MRNVGLANKTPPFAVLWTLMAARLFSLENGSTSLIGFNFSNSVNADTIRKSGAIRRALLSINERTRDLSARRLEKGFLPSFDRSRTR